MSFWSKLGIGASFVGGGVIGGTIAMKIAGRENRKDNDRFLRELQYNPYMQSFVASRFPGAASSIYSMTDKEVASIRQEWEKSPMKRLSHAS